jgi:RNAse (barnase) inhibitor barstar
MSPSVVSILEEPQLNGVYRLAKPSDLVPALDGRVLTDKGGLLVALGWALEFPDYYGANWDALEECLADMSWRPGAISLHIDHANALAPELLDTLVAIFSDVAEAWKKRGRVCSLFLSGVEKRNLPLAG